MQSDFEKQRLTEQKENLKRYLTQKAKLGITWEKYLLICKELGQEPDFSKKPIDFSELSNEAVSQIEIYNQMQDTYLVPGMSAPIYTGKDYNNLSVLLQIYQVPEDSRVTILEMINIIDEEPIRKSRDMATKQAKKNRIAPVNK